MQRIALQTRMRTGRGAWLMISPPTRPLLATTPVDDSTNSDGNALEWDQIAGNQVTASPLASQVRAMHETHLKT